MAIFTTADGRQIVGAAQAGNEYKGYATKRDITIQLTENGATQDSLDALEYLKAYALYANSVGKSVFPPTTNIYISNNGTTKTVEADDITVDGQNVSIGGCEWNGTAWDFTNAGQSGGGSSGGGVLVVNMTWNGSTATATADKTASEIYNAAQSGVVAFKEDDGEGYSAVGLLHSVRLDHGAYEFYVGNGDGCYVFTASSGNEYPECSAG